MEGHDTERNIGPGDVVLVTGAAGGIGRHIVRALLDAGCEVRAVDRRGPAADALTELVDPDELLWTVADLTEADLGPLLQGCDAVIHTAALVGLSERYEELVGPNVDLTRALWRAARAAGVRHVVHLSCGSVYAPGRGLRDEDADLDAANDYEQSKIDAEGAFLPSSGDSSGDSSGNGEATAWTILRPALVYGPHTESMSAGLVTLPPILRNFTRYLPGFTGGTRTNWCHVEDAAAAVMAVLGHPRAYGQIFNVADDTPLGIGEALTAITEAYGLNVGPLVRFPSSAVLFALSPIVDRETLVATLRGALRQLWKGIARRNDLQTPLRPKVDRNALFYVAEDTVLDASRLRRLGWSPKYRSFQEGIVATIRWYQTHGWAPRFDTDTRVKLRDEASSRYGFAASQELEGRWTPAGSGEARAARVVLDVEFPNIVRADFSGRMDGAVSFEGLVEDAPFEGTVAVRFVSARRVAWEFGFADEKGRGYRCHIEAAFNPLRPLASLTAPTGRIIAADGTPVGEVAVSFGLSEQLIPTLLSFRLL